MPYFRLANVANPDRITAPVSLRLSSAVSRPTAEVAVVVVNGTDASPKSTLALTLHISIVEK
jgi:hypothetical protein